MENDSSVAMKTKLTSKLPATLAIAFGLSLSVSAFGTQSRLEKSAERFVRHPFQTTMTSTERTMHATGRTLSKATRTALNSPMIIGETIRGERKVVTRDGVFVRTEPVAERLGDERLSIAKGRGDRLEFSEERD